MSTITINNKEVTKVEYDGIPVMTVDVIADLHEKEYRKVVQGFKRHFSRFDENIHYFRITNSDSENEMKYLFKTNNQKEVFLFTEKGYLKLSKLFNDKLSWQIQDKLIDSYFRLKNQKTLYQIDIDERCMKLTVDLLRPNEGSKILMLDKYMKSKNVDSSFLPDYTDEEITKSLTALLKQYKIDESAQSVNRKLNEAGILERKSRQSSKGKIKEFWSITEKGQLYGKNLISPQNQRESQPHYYEDTFLEMLSEVGLLRRALKVV